MITDTLTDIDKKTITELMDHWFDTRYAAFKNLKQRIAEKQKNESIALYKYVLMTKRYDPMFLVCSILYMESLYDSVQVDSLDGRVCIHITY